MSIPLTQIAVTTSSPPSYNIFGLNLQTVATQLKRLPESVLDSHDSSIYIESSHYNAKTKTFTNTNPHKDADTLKSWLQTTKGVPIRFLSIPQQFSKGPLQVNRQVLQHVFLDLNIDMAFISVMAAFGDKPRISEPGYDCFYSKKTQDGSFEVCYLHRFLDRDEPEDEYQLRQIGLYHSFNKPSKSHTFIFLQPHDDSSFDQHLQMACQNADSVAEIIRDPFRVHQVLLETYFGNWRWYVKNVADVFQHDSDKFFTADIHKATFAITYEVLQSWHDLTDRTLPLTSFFAAEERIRKGLNDHFTYSWTTPNPTGRVIDHQINQLTALSTSTSILLGRIQNVTSLLSNTIDIRNQKDSAELNGHLYNLTLDTVDDSSSVRIITFLGLFFLPASFIATLFGMNLFDFDQSTRRLVIGKDFWIYIVILVPLTACTMASAWLWKRSDDAARKKKKGQSGLMFGVR